MAANDTVQARVTTELKTEAEAIFKSPNIDTIKAIRETQSGQGTKYQNVDAMFDDLDN